MNDEKQFKYNIIIFGKNGMLGFCMYKYFQSLENYNVIGLDRNDFDVMKHSFRDLENIIKKSIRKESVNILFNAIGVIPQTNTTSYRMYIKVNTLFPQLLAEICKQNNIKYIHPTTDCVFKGSKHESYTYDENDTADDESMYGISKSLGESENACVIRTSIIGHEYNTRRSLLEWIISNKNKSINGYTNHYWNGVTTLQYAKIVQNIIENNEWWNGVRHVHSPDSVSKYELLNYINKVYDLNIKIIPIEVEEYCNRKLSSTFSLLHLNIPSLYSQLEELKSFFESL